MSTMQPAEVERDYSAMTRVLQAYTNDMRPNSFQCCAREPNGPITGFRMTHAKVLSTSGQFTEDEAATGCMGNCENFCYDQVTMGKIPDDGYGDVPPFRFIFYSEDENNSGIGRIRRIATQDIIPVNGPIVPLCGTEYEPTTRTLVEKLDVRGVPIGFEYTFDEEEMAFLSLHLITNTCPHHPSHINCQSNDFYLRGDLATQSISKLTGQDDLEFTSVDTSSVSVFQGSELQPYDRVFKTVSFTQLFQGVAGEYDPLPKVSDVSLSYFFDDEEEQGSPNFANLIDKKIKDDGSLDLLFDIEPQLAPKSSKFNPISFEYHFDDIFTKKESQETLVVERDLTHVGANADEDTCIYPKDVFALLVGKRSHPVTSLIEITNEELIAAQFPIVQSNNLFLCCTNELSEVSALQFTASTLNETVDEKFQEFVSSYGTEQQCFAKNEIDQFNAIRFVEGTTANDEQTLLDIQIRVNIQGKDRWESICGKDVTQAADGRTDVPIETIEFTDYGKLIGFKMARFQSSKGPSDTKIVFLTAILDRCSTSDDLDSSGFEDLGQNLFRIDFNEPAQVVYLEPSVTSDQGDADFSIEATPAGQPKFIGFGHCDFPRYECMIFDAGWVTFPDFPTIQVRGIDKLELPAWSVQNWNYLDKEFFGMMIQDFRVTQDFSFQTRSSFVKIKYVLEDFAVLTQACSLTLSQSASQRVYAVGQDDPIRVNEAVLSCPQQTQEFLEKMHYTTFTRISLTDMQSGEDVTSLLTAEETAIPGEVVNFFSTDKEESRFILVRQLTTIYFGGPAGLTDQSLGNLKTETSLSFDEFESDFEIQVISCSQLSPAFTYDLEPLEVVANSQTRTRQQLPPMLTEDGDAYPEACLNQLSARVSLIGQNQSLEELVAATTSLITVEAVTNALVGTYDVTLIFEIVREDENVEQVILEAPFSIEIVLDSSTVNQNVPPVFEGYQGLRELPLWTVRKGALQSYELPAVIDPDEGDPLKMRFGLISTLEDCDCVQIAAIDKITMEMPVSLDVPEVFQLNLMLSDGQGSSNYTIPVLIDSTTNVTDQGDPVVDNGTGPVKNETTIKPLRVVGQNQTFEDITLTNQVLFQPIIILEEDTTFTFVPTSSTKTGTDAFKDSQQKCVPMSVSATSRGQVFLKFAHPLVLQEGVSSDDFVALVRDTGAIQCQLLSNAEDRRDLSFNWTFNQTSTNELTFQFYFDDPSLVSGTSNNRDAMKINFVETQQFIRCGRNKVDERLRHLESAEVLNYDEGEFIPINTETTVLLPQQRDPVELDTVDIFIEDFGNTTETVTLSSITLSSAVKLPMQFIWGGVNAVQLISHLPLNEINFPSNTYEFFNFLAQIVSFDIFPPTENYEFDFSETKPHSVGFELLDYESINFYDSIGSISLIFLFIVARMILQPIFVSLVFIVCGGHRLKSIQNCCWIPGPQLASIWIRFMLETFLELTIASLLGINLEREILSDQMTYLDTVALRTAQVTIVVGSLFILLAFYSTVVAGRPLMKIRRSQLRHFEEKLATQTMLEEEQVTQLLRVKSLVSESYVKRRTYSMSTLEVAQKNLEEQIQLSAFCNRHFDISSNSSSFKLSSITSKSKESKGNPRPTVAPQIVEEKSHPGQRQHTEKALVAKPAEPAVSKVRNEPMLIGLRQMSKVRNEPMLTGLRRMSTGQSYKSTESVVTKVATEPMLTGLRRLSSGLSYKSMESVDKKGRRKEKIIKFPTWYSYLAEFYLELDHKQYLNLQMSSIFLIRRVIFVLVALHLTASPAAQSLLFILCSVLQSIVLVGRWPYESVIGNVLETVNELTVLAIGYHVLILLFIGVGPQIRLRLGLSMMIIICALITITGIVWLYRLCQETYSAFRRFIRKQRYKKRVKILAREKAEKRRLQRQRREARKNAKKQGIVVGVFAGDDSSSGSSSEERPENSLLSNERYLNFLGWSLPRQNSGSLGGENSISGLEDRPIPSIANLKARNTDPPHRGEAEEDQLEYLGLRRATTHLTFENLVQRDNVSRTAARNKSSAAQSNVSNLQLEDLPAGSSRKSQMSFLDFQMVEESKSAHLSMSLSQDLEPGGQRRKSDMQMFKQKGPQIIATDVDFEFSFEPLPNIHQCELLGGRPELQPSNDVLMVKKPPSDSSTMVGVTPKSVVEYSPSRPAQPAQEVSILSFGDLVDPPSRPAQPARDVSVLSYGDLRDSQDKDYSEGSD